MKINFAYEISISFMELKQLRHEILFSCVKLHVMFFVRDCLDAFTLLLPKPSW